MTCVYRYTDLSDGIIKYVGLVCRSGDNALEKRLIEHDRDDSWCWDNKWKVDFLELETVNDANALESHFIAEYETYNWHNKNKKKIGKLSFIKNDFKWITHNECRVVDVPEKIYDYSQTNEEFVCRKVFDAMYKLAEELAEINQALVAIDKIISENKASDIKHVVSDKKLLEARKKEIIYFQSMHKVNLC